MGTEAPRGGTGPADVIAAVLAGGCLPGVASAYLFGSQAEGRAHRESDVDVGVLLCFERHPTAQARFEVRLRLHADLGAAVGREVDVVILNDAPPLLARRIVVHGRRVFCADGEADHAFVRDAQLRAADIEPFIRRARRTKLIALQR
jgi:predicted nucleotidyltransferase